MTEALPTPHRILDAALEVAALHGIAKLSVADVARAAGVSRPTLYKHFSSKDDLVAQAVLRETERLSTEIAAVAEPFDDPAAAVEAAILATLRLTREHPLLDRLIRTEPQALLPLLMTDTGPVITAVRRVVDDVFSRKAPDLDDVDRRRAADLLSRLLISYTVAAPDDPPEVVAGFMARLTAGGILRPDRAG